MFTGKREPARDYFISARRLVDVLVWTFALGLPTALVLLGIANGESAETIFFMGLFGLIIGVLFASSVPRIRFR